MAAELKITDHQRLMNGLYQRTGAIPDPKAQGAAAKWLLQHNHTVEESLDLLDRLLGQEWRQGRVSLLNVKMEIGTDSYKHPRAESEQSQDASDYEQGLSTEEAIKLRAALIETDPVGFKYMIDLIESDYGPGVRGE